MPISHFLLGMKGIPDQEKIRKKGKKRKKMIFWDLEEKRNFGENCENEGISAAMGMELSGQRWLEPTMTAETPDFKCHW